MPRSPQKNYLYQQRCLEIESTTIEPTYSNTILALFEGSTQKAMCKG